MIAIIIFTFLLALLAFSMGEYGYGVFFLVATGICLIAGAILVINFILNALFFGDDK